MGFLTQFRRDIVYFKSLMRFAKQVAPVAEDSSITAADLVPQFEQASASFRLAASVAEFAEILRGSPWAEGSTLAGVLEEAQRVARQLPEDADVAEFVALLQRAVALPQAE